MRQILAFDRPLTGAKRPVDLNIVLQNLSDQELIMTISQAAALHSTGRQHFSICRSYLYARM